MILDINLTLDSARALTVTAVSNGVIDLAGVGVGVAPPNKFGGTLFGEDIGGGGPSSASPPQLIVKVGTAFTAGGSATLQVQLQASIDTAVTYQPAAWDTIIETDTVAVALLTAGAQVANFTIPNRYLGQGQPRYYRLNYIIATGPMTGGTIGYAGIATGIDDIEIYPGNY